MAVPYYGDFAEDDTVNIPFNTFTSDDPSASCTITNLVNTDIHIHKDAGLTQRNNAAGITVSIDFDGITGNHMVTIDTSDDTVAGFWVTGSEYQVRMEGTTVDGATINAWIGAFSIERAGGALALLKNATYGLSALEGLVDDIGAAGAGLTAIPWNSNWDAEVQSECADALTAYDPPTKAEMDTAHALLATPAQVNAQVLDVLNTDTFAEPGQEAPGATVSLVTKIGYLYKFLRNKITNDGTDIKVYADDTTTVDQKSGVSEAGGTVTRGEFGTGP